MTAPWVIVLCKRYSPGMVSLSGAVLFAIGMVLASFSTRLWQFFLTQGVLVGVGTGLSYIPAVTVTPGWFSSRRGLAMGIVLSGTGIGGLIWAPVIRSLISSVGYQNTLRICGGVSFLLLLLPTLALSWDPTMQQRLRTAGSVEARFNLLDWRIAKTRLFMIQSISAAFQASAYYLPIYFTSTYARSLGYSASTGALFIALTNGLSAFGKVSLGLMADRVGRVNTLLVCTIISALSVLCMWIPGSVTEGQDTRGLFIGFIFAYAITAGVYVSLFPTVLAELFGVQNVPSVNGFLYMLRGFATLVGTPVGGLLIKSHQGDSGSPQAFLRAIIFTGTLLSAASASVLWMRLELIRRDGLRWKA